MSNYDFWIWEKFFTLKKIKEINKFIENHFDKNEPFDLVAKNLNQELKASKKTNLISYYKINKYFDFLFEHIYCVIQESFGGVYYNYNQLDYCHFHKYNCKNKDSYDWHIDKPKPEKTHDYKFTIVVNLSDKKYEGGELQFQNPQIYSVESFNKPGSVIMFKSNISHRVTPIISGERKTIVFFLKKPKNYI
jgi:hypothetical protein